MQFMLHHWKNNRSSTVGAQYHGTVNLPEDSLPRLKEQAVSGTHSDRHSGHGQADVSGSTRTGIPGGGPVFRDAVGRWVGIIVIIDCSSTVSGLMERNTIGDLRFLIVDAEELAERLSKSFLFQTRTIRRIAGAVLCSSLDGVVK